MKHQYTTIYPGKTYTKGQLLVGLSHIGQTHQLSYPGVVSISLDKQEFIRKCIALGPLTYLLEANEIKVEWWRSPEGQGKLTFVYRFIFADGRFERKSYKNFISDETAIAKRHTEKELRFLVEDQTKVARGLHCDHVFPREFTTLKAIWEWLNTRHPVDWATFHRKYAWLEAVTPEENSKRAAMSSAYRARLKHFEWLRITEGEYRVWLKTNPIVKTYLQLSAACEQSTNLGIRWRLGAGGNTTTSTPRGLSMAASSQR